jgi:hypothetical protein
MALAAPSDLPLPTVATQQEPSIAAPKSLVNLFPFDLSLLLILSFLPGADRPGPLSARSVPKDLAETRLFGARLS